MPTFEEARTAILDRVRPLGQEIVPLVEAAGRVLAAPFTAPWDIPQWDNSAMDGYAVRAADAGSTSLKVAQYVPAGGRTPEPVAPGTAAKILTGAPLPPGADTVVRLEDTEERDGQVHLRAAVHPGANVRRRGEDLRAGERILDAGAVIGPTEVGLLASFSRVSVPVFRRARVAILSTGDELVEPGEPLGPGKIYNTNALTLAAAVKLAGGEPVLLGIAPDEREPLRALLESGLAADALVTSAGVSMGDRDLVREVLQDLGVEQVFWKVEIKPGRPTAFAVRGGTPVFSLPGNPVSTMLTFEQFVRPALLRMMGHRKVLRPLVKATLQEDLSHKAGRVAFVRVRVERHGGELLAWSAGNQDTGILKTSVHADGIAIVPAEWSSLRRGASLDVQIVRPGFDMGEERPA